MNGGDLAWVKRQVSNGKFYMEVAEGLHGKKKFTVAAKVVMGIHQNCYRHQFGFLRGISGNSKQRRQKRRAILRYLNQE